ncbi:methylamine utilization protein [Thalassotalea piscium]|uniref:Plastocyanin n=1 Tax=Thalassotalea piscium TaxID=1230533 RepID=A0A7X0NDU5_9GAMM|nr:methylamine utilization protein [Thalassotalea piscium]MBB6541616.1 plastocyanin [Thalassotalea piscium]
MITLIYRITITYFIASFIFSLFACVHAAPQLVINVIDQDQQPLANAVVEVLLKKETTEANVESANQLSNTQTIPTYVIDQINKSFVPEVLVIPKNSLVSFPNSDDLRHHVYSFSAAKTFELKLYAGKPKSPLLFPEEGIVVLGCNIHDAMVGYIYVSNEKQVAKTDNNGLIQINQVFSQIEQLKVWHPNSSKGVDYRKSYNSADLTLVNGRVTITFNVNAPMPRDTFEDQFSHAY